jgi:hypothetical protein
MYYIYKTKKSAYLYVSGLTARGRRVARVGGDGGGTLYPLTHQVGHCGRNTGRGSRNQIVRCIDSLSLYIYIYTGIVV